MAENWLSQTQARVIVRRHLNSSIGHAEKILGDARESGEVRIRGRTDPTLLRYDDGIVGMDLQPGAMNKGGVAADGKPLVDGHGACSEDDLLDWLRRHHPIVSQGIVKSGAPGRPTSIKIIEAELDNRIAVLGPNDVLGQSVADVAQQLSDWMRATHPTAARCAPKTIKNHFASKIRPRTARNLRPKL